MSWNAKTTGAYANTDPEALENAKMIFTILRNLGYAYNPICAVLGNIGWESGYNPWRWQSDIILATTDYYEINHSTGHAYGLFQFDPAGQYVGNPQIDTNPNYGPNFSDQAGVREDGAAQIIYMNNFSGGYIQTPDYPLSFSEFKQSTLGVAYLAHAWCANYERGLWNNTRETNALYWEQELQNMPLGLPVWMYFKFNGR